MDRSLEKNDLPQARLGQQVLRPEAFLALVRGIS